LLIEAGADVNKTGGKFGSPIQAAARAGNIETMKLLIEAGADVNLNAGEYGKAIHAAEAKGNREMASLLRGAGADRNNAPLVITIPEKNPGALKVWCWMLDWSEEEFEGASALQQKALLSTRRQVQPSILKTAFSYIPIYFAGLRLEEQEETSSRSDGSWETTTSSEQCTIIA
jgi:ankyrin repeat protein